MALSRSALACKRSPGNLLSSHLSLLHMRCWGNIQGPSLKCRGRTFPVGSRMIRVGASIVGEQGDRQPEPAVILNPLSAATRFVSALYQFSRPHTMIGTALSIVSISLLALAGEEPGLVFTTALLQALVSALLMNIAIVGINQLYDIEIDKVNKPYLPLASGALTPVQGTAIVTVSAALGIWIGVASGSSALLATLLISLGLGVIYSVNLPFLRWKQYPVLAAGCILAVRAVIVQLGFYTHMQKALEATAVSSSSAAAAAVQVTTSINAATTTESAAATAAAAASRFLGDLSAISPGVWFVLVFMLFFSIVIALFKDLPDVVGDQKAGVRTLSVRLGEGSVFRICVGMLTAAYIWAMAASLALPASAAAKAALFGGHGLLVALLLGRARSVDTRSKADLTSYYMFVWKLFYAEYLLIPLFG